MNLYKQYKPRREFGVILLIECLFIEFSFYKVADVHHDYYCHHHRDLNKQCYQALASVQEEVLGHWTQSLGESIKDLVGLSACGIGASGAAHQSFYHFANHASPFIYTFVPQVVNKLL